MDDTTKKFKSISGLRLALITSAVLFVGLVSATNASAAFEEVTTFGGGNQQLANGISSAVNITGAGGVPAGTVYMVAYTTQSVAAYSPTGELQEIWGWDVTVGGEGAYERCGPAVSTQPTCAPYESIGGAGLGSSGEGRGQLYTPTAIAVDQKTGNVYVLNDGRRTDTIQVYSADGSEVITGFADRANPGLFPEPPASIEETPSELHGAKDSSIAVDETGRVYVADGDLAGIVGERHARIASFAPSTPGDYKTYSYLGRANDIPITPSRGPSGTAVDSAGSLFVEESESIVEYADGGSQVTCEITITTGAFTSMAVNPETGEVFYSSLKGKLIHRLSACNSTGHFEDVESIASEPRQAVGALSINPTLKYSPSRPPGVIYSIQPNAGEGVRSAGLARVYAEAEVTSPTISDVKVSGAGISSATLSASINPRGPATTYRFQFLPRAAYEANDPAEPFAGAAEAPAGGGQIPSATTPSSVSVNLSGLPSATEYFFRVVADNCVGAVESNCRTESALGSFGTFPVASGLGLPDERAYELVSPPLKDGGEVYPAEPFVFTGSCAECKPGAEAPRYPTESAPDGDRVVYGGDPFSSVFGTATPNEYISERGVDGWKTTSLNPELLEGGSAGGARSFTPDLGRDVLAQSSPALTPSAPPLTSNLYLQETSVPTSLTPILLTAPPNEGERFVAEYQGASTDLSHLFFSANDALTGETETAPPATYEPPRNNLYESLGGALRLVNVLPGNQASVPGAVFGGPVAGSIRDRGILGHAISADGEMVYWTAPSGQVYVREEGVRTRELPDHSGAFRTASVDGRKVLLSDGHLLTLEEGGGTSEVDVTGGLGGFLGIVGESEDLSTIYFADKKVLTSMPNQYGEAAGEGRGNIYEWSGATQDVTFIAVASPPGEENPDWANSLVERTAESSPGGGWLAFTTKESLAGASNELGPCEYVDAVPLQTKCSNVYLYGSASHKLVCVSCNPSRESPLGNSTLIMLQSAQAVYKQPRYLTDSGRLYFDTPNKLSSADTNNGIEDVYEYEQAGEATCTDPSGCTELISSGTGRFDANLLAVDEGGGNVFFTTRNQLSPRDTDGLIDLYDARERGGLPIETETQASECRGESCQLPPSAGVGPTVSSSSVQASGAPEKNKKHKKTNHHKKSHHKKKHHSKTKGRSKSAKGRKTGGQK